MAVVAVIAVVIVAVVLSGGSDSSTSTTTTTVKGSAGAATMADLEFPAGVMPYAKAKKEGKESTIDWGKRCDTTTGLLALPLFPQQSCFAPFSGDNGGETATGVTKDSINVVVYLAQPNDPVLKFVYSQIKNDDTVDQSFATYQSYNDMFAKYYETYGRKVVLQRFDATGTVSDPVAAVADAESIAAKKPYLVMGGPLLTNAFADTLAKRKIMCVSCTPSQPTQWYADRSPYVWDIQKDSIQNQTLSAEFIGKELAGHPAAHAGDPALTKQQRVFGYIHVKASDLAQQLEDAFVADLDKYKVSFARIETYDLPTELSGSGRDIITRMKEAGVTTVVFSGDPLAPQTLTKIATEQQYFPEWVVNGTALVDTAAFSRTYDQKQWAHSFGVSNLAARVGPDKAGALYLHQWYYGTPPPAAHTAPVILPNLQFLYNPLQGIGPKLSPEAARATLFQAPIIRSTPVSPQISYGSRGVWPTPDYSGLDDQTVIWWDPAATGPDELGRDGTGLWRFVDKGKRYLPGQFPTAEAKFFDPANTVTIYAVPPPEAKISADYTPVR